MKVGILTLFWGNYNWGGNLQGYALKHYLETHFDDAQVDLIRYCSGRNIVYDSLFAQVRQYSPAEIIKKAWGKLTGGRTKGTDLLAGRKKLFETFANSLSTNPERYTDADLTELAEEYDCLICGSDQVWNPNVARAGYFLSGVGGSCRKVAYAASIARDDLSPHEREVMIPLIRQFDFISVRERTAKRILDRYMGEPERVSEQIDPVLLLDRDEWERLIPTPHDSAEKPYALVFFFSDSSAYRDGIVKWCRDAGLGIKTIPHAKAYLPQDEKWDAERVYDVGPIEFLRLVQGASAIFTDSFHGAVFSLIFEKPFVVFERDAQTKVSKNSRLYDLLDKFSVRDRLIRDIRELPALMETPVDNQSIRQKMRQYRETADAFLTDALAQMPQREKRTEKTVADFKKSACSGCGACAAICPRKAISLQKDTEGFLYPRVNAEACVQCGICVRECPLHRETTEQGARTVAVAANHKDDAVRKNSSSGGMFYAFAKHVIEHGGVVFGADFDERFHVVHRRVEQMDALPGLMRSKYVQSRPDKVWQPLMDDLRAGRNVLFCGTPCQVAAARMLAERAHAADNLYLVDFVCHGVPSDDVWTSYLTYIAKGHRVASVNFREKTHGWHNYRLVVTFDHGGSRAIPHDIDPYMQSFIDNKSIRLSCYRCRFKGNCSRGDITMGDAWGVESLCRGLADDQGTSVLFVRTDKGKALLNAVRDHATMIETEPDSWIRYNVSLAQSADKPVERERFFAQLTERDCVDFWKQYQHVSGKKKIRYRIKRILYATGLAKFRH